MADIQSGWPAMHPDPRRYVYRDLLVAPDTHGNLQFFFANNDPAQSMGGRSITDIVRDLPQIGAGGPLDWLNLFSAGSYETPLDIGLKESGLPIYIIFRIIGPANMYFHPTRKALALAAPTGANRYGHLKHVDSVGTHRQNAAAGCKIVYFACKPSDVTDQSDEFILRIRFEQQPHLGPPRKARILDIDIDPDIRFPGNSVD